MEVKATKSGIEKGFIYIRKEDRYLIFKYPSGKICIKFNGMRSEQTYDSRGRLYIPKAWLKSIKIIPDTILILKKKKDELTISLEEKTWNSQSERNFENILSNNFTIKNVYIPFYFIKIQWNSYKNPSLENFKDFKSYLIFNSPIKLDSYIYEADNTVISIKSLKISRTSKIIGTNILGAIIALIIESIVIVLAKVF